MRDWGSPVRNAVKHLAAKADNRRRKAVKATFCTACLTAHASPECP